jgi:hypothetical protein
MAKQVKTRTELEAMIMAEVRQHPECENVEVVAITRPVGRPWDVAVVRDGPSIPARCRLRIDEITQRLVAQYDLAPDAEEPAIQGAEPRADAGPVVTGRAHLPPPGDAAAQTAAAEEQQASYPTTTGAPPAGTTVIVKQEQPAPTPSWMTSGFDIARRPPSHVPDATMGQNAWLDAVAEAERQRREARAPLDGSAELGGRGELTARASVIPQGSFQRKFSEQPANIGIAAKRLASAIRDQLQEWNASKPNDEAGLTRHNELVAFLETVAAELDKLADMLDRAAAASAAGSPEEPVFLGKAAEIAEHLNAGFMGFLEKNREHVAGYTIRLGLVLAGFGFLHVIGVGDAAATIATTILNASFPSGNDKQKK